MTDRLAMQDIELPYSGLTGDGHDQTSLVLRQMQRERRDPLPCDAGGFPKSPPPGFRAQEYAVS